jgi:hypothetical protein
VRAKPDRTVTDERHVVMDDSAMLAAGRGSIEASRLIDHAHNREGWFLYAPTCAMVEADRVRQILQAGLDVGLAGGTLRVEGGDLVRRGGPVGDRAAHRPESSQRFSCFQRPLATIVSG